MWVPGVELKAKALLVNRWAYKRQVFYMFYVVDHVLERHGICVNDANIYNEI